MSYTVRSLIFTFQLIFAANFQWILFLPPFPKWASWIQRKQSAFPELTGDKLTFMPTCLLTGNEVMKASANPTSLCLQKLTGEVGSPDVMSSASEDTPFQRRSNWHIWEAAVWKTATLVVYGVIAAFSCAYHITKNEGELLFTSCPGVPEHAIPQPGIGPGATNPPAAPIPWTPWEGQGGPGAAALQERLGLEPVLRDRRVHWAWPCACGQGKAVCIWYWSICTCLLSEP